MSQDRPHTRKCRCGTQEKSFKNDIGPFFIGECCKAKGYDTFGNKEGEAPIVAEAPKAAVDRSSTPSEELEKRKAEKAKLQEERAEEISKRKAERDARAKERAERNKKAAEGSGTDGSPV